MALIFLNRKAASLPTFFSQSDNAGKGLIERGIYFARLTLRTAKKG